MRRFTPSSQRNPCPVCDRTKDADCRITSEGVVYCHSQLNGVKPGEQHPEREFVYCGPTKNGHLCGIWKPLHLCVKPDKQRELAQTAYYDYFFWDGTPTPVQRYRKQTAKGKDIRWCAPGLGGRPQADVAPYRWHKVRPELTAGETLFVLKGELKTEQLAGKGLHAISVLGYSERLAIELRNLAVDGIAIVLCPDNDLADLNSWYAELIAAIPSAQTLLPPMKGMDWRYPPATRGLGIEDWIKASSPSQEVIFSTITPEPWQLGESLEPDPAATLVTLDAEDLLPADQSLLSYWGDGWFVDDKGKTKATSLNAGSALTLLRAALPEAAIRLNVLSGLAEVNGSPFSEADLATFYAEVQAQGWNVNKEAVTDVVVRLAQQNRYDPIQEYLNYVAAAPDIEPVDIDKVSTTYLGTTEADFDLYMKVALLGAVKRRFEPGCQFDTVVTLNGDGRIGKSRVWINLASPDWHTSSDAESEKDFLLILHQAWIYEQAELDYIAGKKAVGQLKNLITSSKDTVRAPYGKGMENRCRQGIMVGTVNGPFLQGDEALRARFLVIDCPQSFQRGERIDFGRVATDRDRIWKAAVLAYRKGDHAFLNPEQLTAASERNLVSSEQEHSWLEPVSDWLAQPINSIGPHTTNEILIGSGLRTPERLSRADQQDLSRVMQQIGGWDKDKEPTRHNGRKFRYWRKSEEPDR